MAGLVDADRWDDTSTGAGSISQEDGDLIMNLTGIGSAKIESKMPDIAGDTESWFASTEWVAIDLPFITGLAQKLEMIASSNYQTGYQFNGSANEYFVNVGGSDVLNEEDNSIQKITSIEKGPFSMADTFDGNEGNSGTVDDNPYSQRWLFEQYNLPGFEYQVVAQTPAPRFEYVVVAQTSPLFTEYIVVAQTSPLFTEYIVVQQT